ncbi:MAG: hypothetical protein Q4G40_05100 [Brachybacterium sp.]|nr:hypothetical protein [Brachybacterium sp.]
MRPDTLSSQITVRCGRRSRFHARHGASHLAQFTRDSFDNWTYVPIRRNRITPEKAGSPEAALVPYHRIVVDGDVIAPQDGLFPVHPLGAAGWVGRDGHPVEAEQVVYVWRCPCGVAVRLRGPQLVRDLQLLAAEGLHDVELAMLEAIDRWQGR